MLKGPSFRNWKVLPFKSSLEMHFDQMSENVDLTCEPLVVGDIEDAKMLMTSYSLYLLGVCALMLKDKIRN